MSKSILVAHSIYSSSLYLQERHAKGLCFRMEERWRILTKFERGYTRYNDRASLQRYETTIITVCMLNFPHE